MATGCRPLLICPVPADDVVDHVFPDLHGAEDLRGAERGRRRPEPAGALAPVLARARRRAVRAGDAEIDSGHLLHALLECDEQVLGLAAPLPTQATRLMGYLAQRSIGFGRDWLQGEGESADDGVGIPRQRFALPPGLSDAAEAAVDRARVAALLRDAAEADPLDLLAELASDPDSRAAKMLKGAGADPSAVADRARQR